MRPPLRKPILRVAAIHTEDNGRFYLTLNTGRVIAIFRSSAAYVPGVPDSPRVHTLQRVRH